MSPEPLWTVADLAAFWNVKQSWVYTHVEARDPATRIPHVKLGRLVRFVPEDVRAWAEERVAS